jgi:hypothetical protein
MAVAVGAFVLALPAPAAEWYVGTDGKAGAAGTKDAPLDLASAIGPASPAKPGDTIWVGAGTYQGAFVVKVAGKEASPLTIRALPGQRATIDCRVPAGAKGSPQLLVEGAWTVLWGLEVMCSNPTRRTDIKGSWPADQQRGGVTGYGSNAKFINLLVHDCECGFGFWSNAEGGEIYGCVIYNNGWVGPDRGHGHAIYTQNLKGTKRLVDNIMFNQFSFGIHAYGSSKAFLKGFHVEGNVSFNNGSATTPKDRTPAMLIGGGSPAERIAVLANCTYGDEHGGGGVSLGYTAKTNEDVAVRDNYFVGSVAALRWQKLVFEGNTVIGGGLVRPELPAGGTMDQYTFARNTYYAPAAAAPAFADWQKKGQDAGSTLSEGLPKGVKVFIRPNAYEKGRANVAVYNWDRKDAVDVDLSAVLTKGGRYRVVSAQDFYGKAVAEGVWDGGPVKLPMAPRPAVPPVGMPDYKMPVTQPVFDVFVVLPP